MDFSNERLRKESFNLMYQEAVKLLPGFERGLVDLLTPEEKQVHLFLKNVSFKEGNWFRSFHNVNVPTAMIAICNREGYERDLVYAALLHDAGSSLMSYASTTQGVDWAGVDKRKKHMEIGGIMTYSVLGALSTIGAIDLSEERIMKLKMISETHDDPYIGKDINDPEARAHRCADRTWVSAAVSYYKDFIAHLSDIGFRKKAEQLGFEINPRDFLLCELAWYCPDESWLSKEWDKKALPLETRRVPYNDGSRCEPPYTETGKVIIDGILRRRASELEMVIGSSTPQQFADVFSKACEEETYALLDYATGKRNTF